MEMNGGVFLYLPMPWDDFYHETWASVVYGPMPTEENGLSGGAESPSFCVWAVPGTEA